MINNFNSILFSGKNNPSVDKNTGGINKPSDSLANYMREDNSSFASMLKKEVSAPVERPSYSSYQEDARRNASQASLSREEVARKDRQAQEQVAREESAARQKELSSASVDEKKQAKALNEQEQNASVGKEKDANKLGKETAPSEKEAVNDGSDKEGKLASAKQGEQTESAAKNKQDKKSVGDDRLKAADKTARSALEKGLASATNSLKEAGLAGAMNNPLGSEKIISSVKKSAALQKLAAMSEPQNEKAMLQGKNDAIEKILRDILALKKMTSPLQGTQEKEILSGEKIGTTITALLKERVLAEKDSSKLNTKNVKNSKAAKSSLAHVNVGEKLNAASLQHLQNGAETSAKQIVSRETQTPEQFAQGNKHSLADSKMKSMASLGDKTESSANLKQPADSLFQQGFLNANKATLAQAAKAQADMRTPLMQRQLDSIMQRARMNIKENGTSRFTTSMYPAELGKVSVFLSMTDGAVFGRFTVENDLVKQQLMEYLATLSDNLRQDGLDIEGFEVNVQDNSAQAEQNERDEGGSHLHAGVKKAALDGFEATQKIDPQKDGGVYA